MIFGPLAGQYLGDMGAEVIKLEPPEGDLTRSIGPRRSPRMGAFFLTSNRSKRSIVVDLKRVEGRAKGTPAAIIGKLSAAIQAISAEPAMQQKFMDTGARSVATTPLETFAFAERERVKWKEVVQLSGAKME